MIDKKESEKNVAKKLEKKLETKESLLELTEIKLVIDLRVESVSTYLISGEGALIGEFTAQVKEVLSLDDQNDDLDLLYALRSCIHEVLQRFSVSATMLEGIYFVSSSSSFLLWDKETGKPLSELVDVDLNIDYKTFEWVTKSESVKEMVRVSGLPFLPCFSAYHLRQTLKKEARVQELLRSPSTLFGTLDTWALYQLSHKNCFEMDLSMASKTQLLNPKSCDWDSYLLSESGLYPHNMPSLKKDDEDFGCTQSFLPLADGTPIRSLLSQEVATQIALGGAQFSSACLEIKDPISLRFFLGTEQLIKEDAYTSYAFWYQNRPSYLLESYTISMQSLEKMFKNLGVELVSLQRLKMSLNQTHDLHFIPRLHSAAFPGVKSLKDWSLLGLEAESKEEEITQSIFQSVIYQIKSLLKGYETEFRKRIQCIHITGDWTASDELLQYLSDILQLTIKRFKTDKPYIFGPVIKKNDKITLKVYKSFVPMMDPITSYTGFQEWEKQVKALA